MSAFPDWPVLEPVSAERSACHETDAQQAQNRPLSIFGFSTGY